MTRYYYTDPLAAAWMAKHFGMMFSIMHYGKFVCDPIFFDGKWEPAKTPEEVLDFDPDVALYIHPDSLHLLEPQLWDVLTDDFWDTSREHDGVMVVQNEGSIPDAKRCLDQGYRIIERQGKPFMWPESEGV